MTNDSTATLWEKLRTVLKRRSVGSRLVWIVSFGILFGTLIGVLKGFQLVIANEYFQNRMFRIAGLELLKSWTQYIWLSFKVIGSVLLAVLALGFIGRLLLRDAITIQDKNKLIAISIGILSCVLGFLYLYDSRINRLLPGNNWLLIFGIVAASTLLGWIYHRFPLIQNSLSSRLIPVLGILSFLLFGLLKVALYLDKKNNLHQQPNIVWIVVDSLRTDHLGCYGYEKNTSPHLDRIAQKSLQFKNAFSQESYTKASAASYFTSTYPFVNQVLYTFPTFDTLKPKFLTLAEVLRNQGYATAAFAYNPHLNSLGAGFEVFKFKREYKQRGNRNFDQYETATTILAKTGEYLETKEPGPLFLYLHYMDVHLPYSPPEPFDKRFLPVPFQADAERYMRRSFDFTKEESTISEALYDGEISYTDASIHEVLNLLKEHHLDFNNTIFIFTADHGEDFYDPHPEDPGGMAHYRTLYQELVHVPLIVSAPGFTGRTIENKVGLIDIVPTVLDLVGIDWKKYKQFQGRSLVPLMKGNSQLQDPPLISGGNRGRSTIIIGNWKYYRYEEKCKASRASCSIQPFMENLEFGEQLFDLKSDPNETKDLLSIEPEKTAAMKKLSSQIVGRIPEKTNGIVVDDKTREELNALGYINQ